VTLLSVYIVSCKPILWSKRLLFFTGDRLVANKVRNQEVDGYWMTKLSRVRRQLEVKGAVDARVMVHETVNCEVESF
jgi:hypothetical protein